MNSKQFISKMLFATMPPFKIHANKQELEKAFCNQEALLSSFISEHSFLNFITQFCDQENFSFATLKKDNSSILRLISSDSLQVFYQQKQSPEYNFYFTRIVFNKNNELIPHIISIQQKEDFFEICISQNNTSNNFKHNPSYLYDTSFKDISNKIKYDISKNVESCYRLDLFELYKILVIEAFKTFIQ